MSQLDELLELGADNTAGEFALSGDTLAVLFYALDFVQNLNNWRDYSEEVLDDATVDEIRALVDNATDSLMRPIVTIPVGATMTWHMASPPDRWLLCNGAMVAKADYPELWALWGDTHGSSTTDLFVLLNMTEKSPFGHSGFLALNAVAGSLTHVLTLAEMPAHSHFLPRASGTNGGTVPRVAAANQTQSASPDPETTTSGSSNAHNNLHPVRGVNWIVYAGLP